jgi:fructan beta-fructosidase
LNDPNGLVYSQGEWHLFYQHNPYGWNWGNMHWGHAVSRDLLHWQELPTAIYPKQWGDWAFSGSAVVDARNTSGFKSGKEDVLVAAYTSTGRGECIVYSNDRGRTWTEYDGNPVVKHSGRDPKLIWHAPTSRWVMAVYDEPPKIERGIAFYTSPDLKEWTQTSRIEGFFECPDLFALPVDGNASQQKWVLYAADGKYVLGEFDGKTFKTEVPKQQVWYGNFYAAQTFSDAPAGRRVQIGWANGITFTGQPFNQQMTIPVELSLKTTPQGIRMFAWPVKELDEQAPVSTKPASPFELVSGQEILVTQPDAKLEMFDVQCDVELKQAEKLTLTVCGTAMAFDAKSSSLTCRNIVAGATAKNGKLGLRVIGDRGSLEIFANSGETAMSLGYTPTDSDRTLKIKAEGESATVHRLHVGRVNETASGQ